VIEKILFEECNARFGFLRGIACRLHLQCVDDVPLGLRILFSHGDASQNAS
jgi:hypothetical protein